MSTQFAYPSTVFYEISRELFNLGFLGKSYEASIYKNYNKIVIHLREQYYYKTL